MPTENAVGSDPGETDGRAERARTERMDVESAGPDAYLVTGESDERYVVDLAARDCTCPDHTYRDEQCKHLRRVAIEVTEGRVAPPGRVFRPCVACGERVTLAPNGETGRSNGDEAVTVPTPVLCAAHAFAPGDRVRDREYGDELIVVTEPAGTAGTIRVGRTDTAVVEYPSNYRYDASEPVVGAVYPTATMTADGPDPDALQVYAFPVSRLRRTV